MSLKERLKADLKDAMRAKDIVKRDSIRAINTMIKQIEVDNRVDLDDGEIIKLIQSGIKKREESIEQYKAASRDDLVEKEQSQIDIFVQYLPKQLNDSELEEIVSNCINESEATSMKDMGKVMKLVQDKVAGGADGKRISQVVKKLLAK